MTLVVALNLTDFLSEPYIHFYDYNSQSTEQMYHHLKSFKVVVHLFSALVLNIS